MRYALGLAVALAFAFVGPSVALAGDHHGDHHGAHHHHHDGDGCRFRKCEPPPPPGPPISVVVEPPGLNCPAGGVKVTVFNGPGSADDRVFFVCNGVPGQQGAPGTPGLTIEQIIALIRLFGVNVINVVVNVPGVTVTGTTITINNPPAAAPAPTPAAAAPVCRSTRARAFLALPRRLGRLRAVNVQVDDGPVQRRLVRHNGRLRQARVDMRGQACGPHVVVARRFKIRPTVRIWSVTSAKGITRQLVQR